MNADIIHRTQKRFLAGRIELVSKDKLVAWLDSQLLAVELAGLLAVATDGLRPSLNRLLRCPDKRMLWVSTRQRFRHGDPEWDAYISWIGLPQLREVRTLDAKLNKCVAECGSLDCDLSDVESVLEMLPYPASDQEYYLLGRLLGSGGAEPIQGFDFLGCDLSDETMTSSVLNCGPWSGRLAPFVTRLNSVGLLSVADAGRVQSILPVEWGADEPHAAAQIWALYGRVGGAPDNGLLRTDRASRRR